MQFQIALRVAALFSLHPTLPSHPQGGPACLPRVGTPAAWPPGGHLACSLCPHSFLPPRGGELPSLCLRTPGGAAWDQVVGLSLGGLRQHMFRVWAQLCAGPVLTCRCLSAPVGAVCTGWGRKARGHPTGLCSAAQYPPPPPSELEPALLVVDSVWMLGAGLLRKFLCVLHTGVHVYRFPHALSPAWPLWLWAVPVSALPRSVNALGTGYTVSLALGYPGAARPSSGSLAVLPLRPWGCCPVQAAAGAGPSPACLS